MLRLAFACLSAVLVTVSAAAQPSPFDAVYDDAIPGPQSELGYAFGEEITPPEDAIAYLRTLAAAAPDRMRVVDYATSWEGRALAYGIIASDQNMARLDEIQAGLAQLADPRGVDAATRDSLIADLPAVVWLSYGVHGNEISSTDAGLWTAYHLLAAQNDPVADSILANTIVIVDPVQNPDGRARFVASFTAARGLFADENRFTAEHDEPWPGGRFNHYLFDMNRDWFAMTQPETRGRVAAMQDWWPVVVVDAHEMGGDSSYFFAPSAEPFNPHIAASQRSAQELIGRNNARWFDRMGYDYFTREIFDAFYPGYGDMWPTLHGAVAMTYEQGSARGLSWRRRDGSLLTYADGVDHHFVSSLSTAQAVAENRARFMTDFADFRMSAASDTSGPQAVLLDAGANRWGAARLARSLAAQGIEVGQVEAGVSACGARFQDGAYLVRLDQPAGRLARSLLEADVALPSEFMTRQEERRDAGLGHELYDVTAWSLPQMYNVEAAYCRRAPQLSSTPVDPGSDRASAPVSGNADWGYAIAWTDAGQARLVAALAARGIALRSSDEAFRIGNMRFPRGSVVIPRHGARDDLDTIIADLAAESGAIVHPMASSWVDEGPNPGSGQFNPIRAPRIAMLWGDGVSPTSAGATRYVLERRYGMPVSVIRARSIARANLSAFDAILLPEQGGARFSATLGSSGTQALQRFVRDGGVLVGLGSAVRWMTGGDVDLLPAARERAAGTSASAGEDGGVVAGSILSSQEEREAAETPSGQMPDRSPGALLRIEANENAWMSAGYDGGAAALVTGSDIYAPVDLDEATTAMRFADAHDLVLSGYFWEENLAQTAHKPFILTRSMGAGHVVAFTHSPTTRAYLEGLDLLLLNAVILGPAHSRRLR